ncbi:LuxR C-terminal-related transcriptional regulator [Streptomyces sp. NPDC127178]|uniref:helix-turn-helix transcriptional regulator n=1 Tax=unclassified Streptomyces TaxID=2593676 RepID=UPI00362F86C7
MNPPPLDRTSPPQLTNAWRELAATLADGVRVRVLRAVYGDPRAAGELVPRLTDRQATGLDPLPTDPAELAPSLLRERRAQIRALPDSTRLLLLLAAADQYPVPTDAFLRAVMAARLDTRSLDAAETAGIAHAGAGGVVFRDAWTRIAAYETGSPADRRDVHRLLARVLGSAGETPWRSWHRGAGAPGPSGRLAAELGTAARKAATAGRLPLARALTERAAALCPEPSEQARLLTRAAGYAWRAGDGERARRLAAAGSEDALTGVLALRAGNAEEAFDALVSAVVRVGAAGPGAGGAGSFASGGAGIGAVEGGELAAGGAGSGLVPGEGGPGPGSPTTDGGAGSAAVSTEADPGAGPRPAGAVAGGGTPPGAAAPDLSASPVGEGEGRSRPTGVAADRASLSRVRTPPGPAAAPAGAAPVASAAVVAPAPAPAPSAALAAPPAPPSAVVAIPASVPSGAKATPSAPPAAVVSPASAPRAAVATPAPTPPVVAPVPTTSVTVAPRPPAPATHLLARATEAAIYTGDLRRLREAARVADRLGVVSPGTLGGLVAAFEGRYEDARELLEAAAGRCGPGGDPTVLIHAGIAALLLGDHTRAATATLRAAASARARGTPVTVPQAMEFRAYADFWTGRPRAGEAAAADALWQAHATGQDNGACHLQAALAMFSALTGDADLCHERAASARSYALARGLGLPAALAQWALAYLDLSSGRFAAAAARLRALAGFGPGHGHRAIRHLAAPHYVEAAVRTGDTRVARVAHADYHRWASAVRSPDDLALSARCRALLAPGSEAVDHYRVALDLHSHGTRDFERARTELLFGSTLRRLRSRTEARDRLHSALEAFDSFGAPHCAAQARSELRALGTPAGPTRTGPDTPTGRLTAQQLLVARMAAEGATNREIADRLALSPRTIDHHLRGVFSRLGIRSRIELVRLIAEVDESEGGTTG